MMAGDIRCSGPIDVGRRHPPVISVASPVRPHSLRLTRRGRTVIRGMSWVATTMIVALVVVVAVFGYAAVSAPGAQAGDSSTGAGAATVAVVVAPGDSLWSLARDYQPGRDPRDVVAEIEDANGLRPGALLPAGATLLIPVP